MPTQQSNRTDTIASTSCKHRHRTHRTRRHMAVIASLVAALTLPIAASPISAYADIADDLETAQQTLDEYNSQMQDVAAKLEQAESDISTTQEQIDGLTRQSEDTQERLSKAQGELGAVLARDYKGGESLISAIVSATSFDDLVSNVYYVRKEASVQVSALQEASELQGELADQTKELQDRKKQQEDAKATLESQQEELEKKQQEQADYVSSLADDVRQNIYALQKESYDVQHAVGEAAVSTAGGASGKAKTAIEAALSKIGAPYVYGSGGPNTFDCSGLVSWAYRQAGVSIAHSSNSLKSYVQAIGNWTSDLDALKPGDLVLYSHDGGRTTYHVALYLGDGMVVHANGSETVVSDVDYDKGAIGGGSPIR